MCLNSIVLECEDPGVPANGRRVFDDFSNGSRVYFVCNDGHEIKGPNVLFCQENATWDGLTPNCTLVDSKYHCYYSSTSLLQFNTATQVYIPVTQHEGNFCTKGLSSNSCYPQPYIYARS